MIIELTKQDYLLWKTKTTQGGKNVKKVKTTVTSEIPISRDKKRSADLICLQSHHPLLDVNGGTDTKGVSTKK